MGNGKEVVAVKTAQTGARKRLVTKLPRQCNLLCRNRKYRYIQ